MTETSAQDDDGPIVVQNADQFPYVIMRGNIANLSALRQADSDLRWMFFRERHVAQNEDDAEDGDSQILLLEPSMKATIRMGGAAATTDGISGEVFVTRSQVLFVANDQDQSEHDVAIGASCIILHAMMEEPQMAVYLQLNEDDNSQRAAAFAFGDSEDGENDESVDNTSPLDATIEPVDQNDCQRLFKSLCKLVALHPMEDDEDEGNDFGGGMFGGNDDLIWAPAGASMVSGDEGDGDRATESERDGMLERLDNLLVVRPEFEIQDGQFDDADTDETGGASQ
ncbi:MAG: hypothetical protein SGILL_007296 [Bacillariaceae sp.]